MTKTKKGDWVLPGGKPGELGWCTRCGQGLTINLPQPIPIVVACMKAFVKMHSNCQPGKHIEKPAQTPSQWAVGRDTGISSATIYTAITGEPGPYGYFDVPYDPDDFGRCYRLLKLFPAFRPLLEKTVKLTPKWEPFVKNWDELTNLYEEELPSGNCPKLYKRIQILLGRGSE